MKNIILSLFVFGTLASLFIAFSFYNEAKSSKKSLSILKSKHQDESVSLDNDVNELKKELFELRKSLVIRQLEFKEETDQNETLVAALRDKNKILQRENVHLTERNDVLHNKIEQLQVSHSSLSQSAKDKDAILKLKEDELEKKKNENPMGAVMSKMMEADGMKDMIKMQVDQQYNVQWSSFKPDMDETMKEIFDNKLKEFQMKQAEVGMAFFNMNEEEKNEKTEELIKGKEEFENEMMGFLGVDIYDEYKEYKKTIGVRTQLNMMKNFGFTLDDDEKKEKMLTMFIETQNSYGVDSNEDEKNQLDLNKIGENMNNIVSRNKKLSQEYLIRANDFLNEDEYDTFKQSLDQYNKTMEIGVKMSSMLLNKKEAEVDQKEE